MRAVIRTYAGSKSSKIAKPDNKLTTSFSARRFSGAVIACGSLWYLILAAVSLSATLASNAPAEDKKHIQAAQDAPGYRGVTMRFPNGNGFIFSIGTFRIIVPPLIVQLEALD